MHPHWISFVMTILEIFTIDTIIRIMISELILVIFQWVETTLESEDISQSESQEESAQLQLSSKRCSAPETKQRCS